MKKKVYTNTEYDGEIDYSLVMKFVETREESYLKEWLESEESLNSILRILRGFDKVMPGARRSITAYLSPTAKYIGGIHPDLVGLAYIHIAPLIRGYKVGEASLNTYLYTFLPKIITAVANKEKLEAYKFFAQPYYMLSDNGDEESELDFISGDYMTPDREALLRDYIAQVNRILDDELDRKIFSYLVNDYNQSEIASKLNLKDYQVGRRVRLAREKILTHLPELTEEVLGRKCI